MPDLPEQAAREPGRMDRVALAGAGISIAALAWGSFLVSRPNRLAAGLDHRFLDLADPVGRTWLAAAAALWLGLAWSGLRRPRPAARSGLGAGLAALLLLGLIWVAGTGAARLLDGQPPIARVGLGAGFWGAALGLLCPVMDGIRRRRGPVPAAAALGLAAGCAAMLLAGHLDSLSLLVEYAGRKARFWAEAGAHLRLACIAASAGVLLGAPLGLLVHARPGPGSRLMAGLDIVQTIPSLALFGLLMAPLAFLAERSPVLTSLGVQGIGWAPAAIALTLYALLPVVRSTAAGFGSVDRGVVEAGLGLGMDRLQLLRRVELPLALPVVLGGIRVALVQAVGNTAVAALIGAGGLGVFIFQGLGQAAMDLVLLGALPTVALALLADLAMQAVSAALAPGRPGQGSGA
jgi:osmoprotectant transport system permease protein